MARPYDGDTDLLKFLVYGKPGAGKTTFVATAALDPRLAPVLMLEAFGNPISIRSWPVKPDIITLEHMSDFNDPYAWIIDGQKPDHPYAKKFNLKPPYKTLIIDGLTEVQRFVVRKITGIDNTNPGDLTTKLERQGFGQLLGTMLNWAVKYYELPVNVVITSLEAAEQKIPQGPIYAKPLIWGQSGSELAGYAYTVMRIVPALAADKQYLVDKVDPLTTKTINLGTFNETLSYYGKDQSGIPVKHLTDPTFTKILDLLERSKVKTQP